MATTIPYTHLELDKDVPTGISGYYTPLNEVRMKYDGREILYVTGKAVVESSCCGAGSWMYVIVPGFVVNWQHSRNNEGLPVSDVEPIADKDTRD
ncbi:MAG: hypothetical protein HY665_05840, partial [Chloroflexi bacterium]|nr:hypothetical protein [Chloroflexota bacterium]